jgi:calcium-dependent protein kinase
MGGSATKGLNAALVRTESRVGKVQVTGRYHRHPKKLEDDYHESGVVLGQGYNGSVFLADSKTSKLKFAVKGFKLTGLNSERKEELTNEVEIFLGMDHPHVARLNDVYETSDMLYLVMECMSGGELFKRVCEKKRFSEKDAADAAWQMLLAIAYVHSHGIVHRDIKLENYLYEAPTSNHLKLIDFGFSKVWNPDTKLHLSCGTLAYVAPEVLGQSYTSKCDMWSYGVTVFILLMGYMPFSGTETHQSNCIKQGNWKKKPELWSKISNSAQDFLSSLLVVDVNKRLSAEQALKHDWIAKRDHMIDNLEHVDQGVADALVTFGQASHFRRACMEMMAWSLTNDERKEVRDAFLELDKDRSGAISMQEFKKVMKDKFHISDQNAQQAFEALDTSHHDEIHYTDFLAAMVSTRIRMHDDMLRATFKRFDTDNSGYIDKEDLKQVLGDAFEGESIDHLMEEAHAHDGKISLDDFMAFLKHGDAGDHHHDAATRIIDKAIAHPDHAGGRERKMAAKSPKEVGQVKPGSCCSVM